MSVCWVIDEQPCDQTSEGWIWRNIRAPVVANIPRPQLESMPRAQQCLRCCGRLLWGQVTGLACSYSESHLLHGSSDLEWFASQGAWVWPLLLTPAESPACPPGRYPGFWVDLYKQPRFLPFITFCQHLFQLLRNRKHHDVWWGLKG